jgi:hypothetical protein
LKILNEQLFPLLCENGRVVDVSSTAGPRALSGYSNELREKYLSPTLTIEQLDRFIEDYISAIETYSYSNTSTTMVG